MHHLTSPNTVSFHSLHILSVHLVPFNFFILLCFCCLRGMWFMVQAILMETNRFVLKSTTGSSRINNIMALILCLITSDGQISSPSIVCKQDTLWLWVFFLTLLPWEFIYAKLCNCTILKQGLMGKFAQLT